ncbi:long-chain-fatty-acid--CoA ligase [Mycolicibacter sinensis]|uniref:Long-chain-fatty-acid--CoA ligase FadD13 n=1 Tax=Mycolicibacter sinensis (strain JDM601) TaxID=875328 RepID=A0A1A3U090_MYCSD|nr:long-chain-fatty-acid--CoA ligase [Mycolicibacter sinensis]OBK88132.1 long-chain fatty acid--CoA ligase [Mycolicibacter sinensis]
MNTHSTVIFDIVRNGELQWPDRIALQYGESSWTWKHLGDRVRRNASAQREAGLRSGDRVAFLDKNSAACLETTLACGLGGTVNAVVNFRLAPTELTYVINDSTARILFVGHDLREAVDQIRGDLATVERIIVVGGPEDEYESFVASADAAMPADCAKPDDCFVQLYTSGTTGFPKGAMLTHRSLLTNAAGVVNSFQFVEDSVNMVAMPLFHVSGTGWALAGMSVGAQTIVVRDVVPDQILAQFGRDRVTHAFFVPAVYGFFLETPGLAKYDFSSLRCLGYGGSPMPSHLLRRALEVFSVDFYQVYGMTEASGAFSILGPAEHRDSNHPLRLNSAGRAIPGTEIRVVDRAGHDLPDGEIGEFVVRGDLVMAGYWCRPTDTASTVVDGWLHTGDAGRRDSDGYLYIEDRIKDMIISGGENVYPAEIERVLSMFPDIGEIAVIGVPDEKWGEAVKAVVAPKPGAFFDEEKFLAYARDNLAGYKRPKSVDVMAALPRNATGKILKRELRAPYWKDHQRALG